MLLCTVFWKYFVFFQRLRGIRGFYIVIQLAVFRNSKLVKGSNAESTDPGLQQNVKAIKSDMK